MKITQKIPYNFKKLLPILGIAALTACEPHEPVDDPTNNKTNTETPNTPDTTNTPTVQKHNVELEFDANNLSNIHMDTVQKYLDDEYVDSVYLVLNKGSSFSILTQKGITNARNYMQQRTDLSPRVRGRGNFYFQAGRCLPADSLYFVSKGWKVKTF